MSLVSPDALKFIASVVKDILKVEKEWEKVEENSKKVIEEKILSFNERPKDVNNRQRLFELLFKSLINEHFQKALFGESIIFNRLLFVFMFPYKNVQDNINVYIPVLFESVTYYKNELDKIIKNIKQIGMINYIFKLNHKEIISFLTILNYLLGKVEFNVKIIGLITNNL